MAFELLNKVPHGVASDLYSLAVVAYELIMKNRPYKDSTDAASLDSVAVASRLPSCSPACKAFISKGLARDLNERFASSEEMMNHEWFASFDWAGLKNRTLKPPFIPNTEIANCDTGTNDLSDAFGIGDEEKSKINPKDQALFAGYDYRTVKDENGVFQPQRTKYESPKITVRSVKPTSSDI